MKLIDIYRTINESEVIGEDYPASWNIQEFAKLRTYAERVRYCEQHLTKIKAGSGRIVYKIDDEKVLKLAKNPKGVAQNEKEIEWGADYYHSSVLAQTFEAHEKGLWVEMELARPCTKALFKQINGYSFDDYCTSIRYFYFTTIRPSRYMSPSKVEDESVREMIYEDPFYSTMTELMHNADMPVGDLERLSSYGVVSRDGHDTVVVVDYGLDNEIFSTHYSKR